MNLLEPWVFFRLFAGAVALTLFARAAWVSARVLAFDRLGASSEGQLTLERQSELAATASRVGGWVQALTLFLTVAAADRLAPSLRGAMCGYGVVHAGDAGPWSVGLTAATAVLAGVQGQLLRLDGAYRRPALRRPIAWSSVALGAAAAADFGFALTWLGGLDLKAIASCCASGLDAGGGVGPLPIGAAAGMRRWATGAAAGLVPVAAAFAYVTSRRAERGRVLAAGGLGAVALVPAFAAVILEVAPHVYETPGHRCPYCLFRADAYFLGYPLYGALFAAVIWSLGALCAAAVAPSAEGPFGPFARRSLRREAAALGVAFVLGAAPVVRFAVVSGGASLF